MRLTATNAERDEPAIRRALRMEGSIRVVYKEARVPQFYQSPHEVQRPMNIARVVPHCDGRRRDTQLRQLNSAPSFESGLGFTGSQRADGRKWTKVECGERRWEEEEGVEGNKSWKAQLKQRRIV